MRFAFLAALTLAACSSDPAPVTDAGADTGPAADLGADVGTADVASADTGIDAGPTIDDPPVTDTGPTADASDAGAVDTGTDVGTDAAPVACIPACGAGLRCVGGACVEAPDAGSVDVVDAGPPSLPAREPREFLSCEPVGASCGGDAGVTCVRSMWLREDAGARGACLRSCEGGIEGQCPSGSTCLRGLCVILCDRDAQCGDAGTRCLEYSIGTACL